MEGTGLPKSDFGINIKSFVNKHKTSVKMKKLLLVLAIGTFAVACNSETATDASKAADSLTNAATEAAKTVDTLAKSADSTVKAAADSLAKAVDTLKK